MSSAWKIFDNEDVLRPNRAFQKVRDNISAQIGWLAECRGASRVDRNMLRMTRQVRAVVLAMEHINRLEWQSEAGVDLDSTSLVNGRFFQLVERQAQSGDDVETINILMASEAERIFNDRKRH